MSGSSIPLDLRIVTRRPLTSTCTPWPSSSAALPPPYATPLAFQRHIAILPSTPSTLPLPPSPFLRTSPHHPARAGACLHPALTLVPSLVLNRFEDQAQYFATPSCSCRALHLYAPTAPRRDFDILGLQLTGQSSLNACFQQRRWGFFHLFYSRFSSLSLLFYPVTRLYVLFLSSPLFVIALPLFLRILTLRAVNPPTRSLVRVPRRLQRLFCVRVDSHPSCSSPAPPTARSIPPPFLKRRHHIPREHQRRSLRKQTAYAITTPLAPPRDCHGPHGLRPL
ncbi:hypothetical protein B0H14DRAFT_3545365 [Mycena olivaceomarginata]|nr:hypothetical protein B0H14DRAFT_3545365 [Mycena olivaceomarginata]